MRPAFGHVGIVACGRTPASGPQFQYVTFSPWGLVAFELPATTRNPGGNACTGPSVWRR